MDQRDCKEFREFKVLRGQMVRLDQQDRQELLVPRDQKVILG